MAMKKEGIQTRKRKPKQQTTASATCQVDTLCPDGAANEAEALVPAGGAAQPGRVLHLVQSQLIPLHPNQQQSVAQVEEGAPGPTGGELVTDLMQVREAWPRPLPEPRG